MKKLLVTITASLACIAAFGQGQIAFSNDSLHLAYFSTDTTKLAAGDTALAGRGLYKTTTDLAYGSPTTKATFYADLYAGTSASSLSLTATTAFDKTIGEGKWTAENVTLPTATGFAAGSTVYFQVAIRDSRDGSYLLSSADGHYFGLSSVFTAVVQTSPSPLTQLTSPVNSTWQSGSFVMPTLTSGSRGAIEIGIAAVPEPASFALAGLGAAALVIFRRRK